MSTCHTIAIDHPVLMPADGILLGNGDLSVSIYQKAGQLVWRFGKGDVWDRRIDFSDDPRPAHIDEVAHGIRDEGWKCGPYGGPVEATRGTSNPRRMQEICQGCPPSYHTRPYPCPKPVGELAMRLPNDGIGLSIRYELIIEQALAKITCRWQCGLRIEIQCFIAPATNVLAIRWTLSHDTLIGERGQQECFRHSDSSWFHLYRWADPTIAAFAERYDLELGRLEFGKFDASKSTPLPRPNVRRVDGLYAIEQAFPADPTFPNGFKYLLAARVDGIDDSRIREVPQPISGTAHVEYRPDPHPFTGEVFVAVATTRDDVEPERIIRQLPTWSYDELAKANREAADEFWSRSAIAIDDPLLEKLWYANVHARRCTFRAGTVSPGLFLPSTVEDYSFWHGDYHTNYNIQSPFIGDYASNHLDIGDNLFDVMEYFLFIGRKIARDYYGCRGAFIQLSGYPVWAADDPLGAAPMGRMAYMTGWTTTHYWQRYRMTMDIDWLRCVGYPAIRDLALFYTDFLKPDEKGVYHAFPSNQGEDGFTGDATPYTDRAQIMRHARYCLLRTIDAAKVLGADTDLQSQWRSIVDHLGPEDSDIDRQRRIDAWPNSELLPPEFMNFDGRMPFAVEPGDASFLHDRTTETWLWYCGKLPYIWSQHVRGGCFVGDRDFDTVREHLMRWTMPNGLVRAMTARNYGSIGWTESMSIFAPIQEMMLQSWSGTLHIFPAWPMKIDAAFSRLRAEGAFLVSSEWKGGRIGQTRIMSLAGERCIVANRPNGGDIRVQNATTGESIVRCSDAVVAFDTQIGAEYLLEFGD